MATEFEQLLWDVATRRRPTRTHRRWPRLPNRLRRLGSLFLELALCLAFAWWVSRLL